MTTQEAREAMETLHRVILELTRLAWLPTTLARLARRTQLDRERERLLRLIQDEDGRRRNGQVAGS